MIQERCPACAEVYQNPREIRRLQADSFCTACAQSVFGYEEPIVPLWHLKGSRFLTALARRFRLPRRAIEELRELYTRRELFDLLIELEDAGWLAVERRHLKKERRAARLRMQEAQTAPRAQSERLPTTLAKGVVA